MKQLHKAELYTILALLVFGPAIAFLLPVGAGYDEETHLLRIWEMSALEFVPNEALGQELPFPAVYWEMSYRRPFIVRAVESDFHEKYRGLSLDSMDYIYRGIETRSVYAPPLLLPQAVVMRYLGRGLGLPALTVYYAIRITGLLCFLVLAWLAVRLIPFGKWILAVLAASPVAVMQAAIISTDAVSNGIAFLFIAGVLAVANRKEIRRKEWLALAFLFLILFWGKLNIVLLAILPFLVIRPSQFRSRSAYFALLATAIGLFLVEVLGWSLIAYSRLGTPPEGTDPLGQVRFILSQPFDFLAVLARYLTGSSLGHLLDWVALYGFAYWPVPALVFPLYLIALLASLFVKEDTRVESRTRWGLLIVFLVTYFATLASMYVTFNPVGADRIDAVQGRYFVTVMPLLFLALACLPLLKRTPVPYWFPSLLVGAGLLLYLGGMYLSYHVPCGSQYYRADLCYQPNYKNWAPNDAYSSPISDSLTLRQEIVAECSGMTELRVWVNAAEADPNAFTQFTLTNVQQQREVVRTSVQNSDLPTGAWYALNFDPDWGSDGEFYILTISTQNDNGPQVAYSLRQEYPAGKLFENDEPIQRDVIFQTGCIAGWNRFRLTGSPWK
jgi:uncharacterized membrane protein